MSAPKSAVWTILFTWTLLLAASMEASAHQPDACSRSKEYYAANNYHVRTVKVENYIGFLDKVSSGLNPPELIDVFAPNHLFTLANLTTGRAFLQQRLNANANPGQRVKVDIISTYVSNCTAASSGNPPLLDVVFRVFTTNYNAYLSNTWEFKKKTEVRPEPEATSAGGDTATPSTSAQTDRGKSLRLDPFVGYNHTQRLFGGTQLSLRLPEAVLRTLNIGISASGVGNNEFVDLEGARSVDKAAMNLVEYKLSYKHSDLPAGANRFREGLFQFQVNAASKPFGDAGIVVRYGATLETGNRQSDKPLAPFATGVVSNTASSSLKTYIGGTFVTGRSAFTASYGLELGEASQSANGAFTKHVVDVAFSRRWIPDEDICGEVHKVLSLELRGAAGVITGNGTVPLSERFFGGNVPNYFIQNAGWEIVGGPYLRSMPQNRLGSSPTIGGLGGDKFYSLNVTIARPFWGQPILPKEIIAEPGFTQALTGAQETVHTILFDYYAIQEGLYDPIATRIIDDNDNSDHVSVRSTLAALKAVLDKLPQSLPDDTGDDDADDFDKLTYTGQLSSVTDQIVILIDNDLGTFKDSKETAKSAVKLIEDSEGCDVDLDSCSTLNTIVRKASIIADRLRGAVSGITDSDEKQKALTGIDEITSIIDPARPDSIPAKQVELLDLLHNHLDQRIKDKIDKLVKADTREVDSVLFTFRRELNLYSIGLVGMFDTARIFPDPYGTRFGAGGGVRLSLANFSATFGYVFNINRKPGDGIGALTFSIDVLDLFRGGK